MIAGLAGFPLRFVLAPFGLVALVALLLPGRRELEVEDAEDGGAFEIEGPDAKLLKKSSAAAEDDAEAAAET